MPTLPELLSQLQFITQDITLLGLLLTAGVILVARDWRFLIFALLLQYILIGLILSRLVRPDIATLKVLIGAFICPILFLSARQVSVSHPLMLSSGSRDDRLGQNQLMYWWYSFISILRSLLIGKDRYRGPAPTGLIFRLLTVLLLILVASTLSQLFALPVVSANITTAVYWLVLAGLITLILTENPMKVGLGLLTVLAGFDLIYTNLEASLLLTGFWGMVNLLIALAIGYLIVVKGMGPEEEM